MEAYFSNRMEQLYQELKGKLFSEETTPFTRRLVVVPGPAMKQWLMRSLAEDPEVGIAAGLQITYIDSAVKEVAARLSIDPSVFPRQFSETELALRIEIEIRGQIAQFCKMDENAKSLWLPLLRYILSADPVPEDVELKGKENRRILALAQKMANLFLTYGNYGSRMLRKWQKREQSESWQEELWKRCINQVFPEHFEWKGADCVVHLFGMSFVPDQQLAVFNSLSKTIPVFCYLLSPCQVFWSEILSDRECRSLIQYWEKKNADEAQQIALEEYIYDRNPILANYGRVGREMALQIENSGISPEEKYLLPEKISQHSAYSELVVPGLEFSSSKESSLLDYLQADLLLMRTPSKGKKESLTNDSSVRVYSASSTMREVQTLYDAILGILQKHKDDAAPILPEDIVVMAPDIAAYEPYIRSVFAQDDNALDYQVMDLGLLFHHTLTQGFRHLLSLANSRWNASAVLQLFEVPEFQGKHSLSLDDIAKIKDWMKQAEIKWGMDPVQRSEILKRDFDEACEIDPNPSGTWKKGFERLLMGMAMILPDDKDADQAGVIPLNSVDTSQMPLFGKWVKLLQSLQDDLRPLSDGRKLPLKKWSIYLRSLLEGYFELKGTSAGDENESENLLNIIEGLAMEGQFTEQTFSFQTVLHHLDRNIDKRRLCYRESHLHAVRFCSMLPMRALPAKVVVLLGMSEEQYPRREGADSLNLLKSSSERDYCPTKEEFDRYLFLESILSARQYLILSYSGFSAREGTVLAPSILVSELLDYLDGGYTIDGKKASEALVRTAPFNPYDKSLFEPETSLQGYSKLYYGAAKAHYQEKEKQPVHCFIPSFERKDLSSEDLDGYVELRKLKRFAKDPLGTYLREKHGMYFEEVEDTRDANEEILALNALQKWFLKSSTPKQSFENILRIAELEGKLPQGPFREYFIEDVRSESQTIEAFLNSLCVSQTDILSIKLSEEHAESCQNEEGDWLLPPLECSFEGGSLKIIGTIPYVSPQGLMTYSESKKEKIPGVWPEYLVYLCLVDMYQLPLSKNILFLKDPALKECFISDPFKSLETFLGYYVQGMQNASPLVPEWIEKVIRSNADVLREKIQSDLASQHFHNDRVKWVLEGGDCPNPDAIIENWAEIAQDIFSEPYERWSGKKKSGGKK